MAYYVYKYVFQNEIIYIGKAKDLERRLKQHGVKGDNIKAEYWDDINNSSVYYCELANEMMADVVESYLIKEYRPKCNVAKVSNWNGFINFPLLNWVKYIPPKKEKLSNKRNNVNLTKNTRIEECDDVEITLKDTLELLYQIDSFKKGDHLYVLHETTPDILHYHFRVGASEYYRILPGKHEIIDGKVFLVTTPESYQAYVEDLKSCIESKTIDMTGVKNKQSKTIYKSL